MSTRLELTPAPSDPTLPVRPSGKATTRAIPPEVTSAKPEARFGKFVRVQRIGAGAMGEVWKAWDTAIDRWVALKFLKSHDADEEARFDREARIAASLIHSHIASIYETGVANGQRFIAMQYVRGSTLDEFPDLPRRDLVTLIRDAALALHAAHEKGIVHRDIKPGNLMVATKPDGRPHVYVLDFGLARPAAPGSDISASGIILGTPAFMSPEQARGDLIDARGDTYSLGATLWSLLTHRIPFAGDNVYDLLRRVERDDPTPLHDIDPSIDPDLELIVAKAMEKSRTRRYPSALAFSEDLTRWLGNQTIQARPASAGYRFQKWRAGHRGLLVMAGVSAIAILIVVALVVPRWMSERREGVHQSNQTAGVEKRRTAKQELDRIWCRVVTTREWTRQAFRKPEEIRGELEKSVVDLNAFIESHDDMMQGWYVRGRARLALGDREGAREDFRRSTAITPDFALGWFYLALTGLEDFQEAFPTSEDVEEVRRRKTPLLEESVGLLKRVRDGAPRPPRDWGLSASPEDDVVSTVADALVDRYVRNLPEEGRRRLEEAFETRKAEEFCLWLGRWATPPDQIRWYERGIAIAPHGLGCLLDRGMARLASKDWEGATEDFTKSIVINPNKVLPRLGLADVHRKKGEFAAAEEAFTVAIGVDPSSGVAYLNRGVIRQNRNSPEGALQDYTKAIEVDPRLVTAYANRGKLLQTLGQADRAMTDFSTAIQLNPGCSDAYSGRAGLWLDKGNLALALQDANHALAINPSHVQALSNRGNVYVQLGKFEQALADHTRTITLEPKTAQTWINRAVVHGYMNNSDAALEDLERAIQVDPRIAEAYLDRGTIRGMRGEVTEMMTDYDKAIELDGRNPIAFFNRGLGHKRTANLEKAIEDLTTAIRLKPDFYNAYVSRGEARQARNDRAGARSDYEQALRLAPANWEWRESVKAQLGSLSAPD